MRRTVASLPLVAAFRQACSQQRVSLYGVLVASPGVQDRRAHSAFVAVDCPHNSVRDTKLDHGVLAVGYFCLRDHSNVQNDA